MEKKASAKPNAVVGLEFTIREDEPPSMAVVRGLDTATVDDGTEIPPLYESIDPDALNALCSSLQEEGRIEFQHHGFHITVGEGTISFEPSSDDTIV